MTGESSLKLGQSDLLNLYRSSTVIPTVTDLIDIYCKDKEVLDVGCANYEGHASFGAIHKKVLSVCRRCVGVDISQDIFSLPKSDKSEYHLGNAETFRLENRRFDVIFAGDVIEHFSNPGLFLENAQKMLADGGRLLIVTPNPFAFRSWISLVRFFEPAIHEEHTCYLSVASLNEMASRFNLQICRLYYITGQSFDGDYRWLPLAYRTFYRGILSLRIFRRFADTFAFELTATEG